ncbi:MAG TPA: HAD family phosphatase [Vicinamibacterales bacterium]|nr:HAD family phosphatase [Vicinamibacterales bacterium]
MIRAVVFDFDGVIANSEPLHFRAYRDVLADRGLALSEAAYYEHYLGYDDIGAFHAIAADAGTAFSDETIAELVARKATRLEALETDGSVLFPGAREAIARIAAAWPVAIASGALKAEILRVLDHESLRGHFPVVVGAEDTPASKPDPAPYLHAIELLAAIVPGLAPAECVAIEDSRWGLLSARAAGLRTVAITHTYPSAALADVADAVIDHLDRFTPALLSSLHA